MRVGGVHEYALVGANGSGLVPLAFVGVGGVVVLLGLRDLCRQVAFHRRALRCRGVVTDFRTKWRHGTGNERGHTVYYPVLAFRTVEGRDVETAGRLGRSRRGFRPGQAVTVTYDPRDPSHAYPGTGASAVVQAVVSVVFGGVFVAMAWTVFGAHEAFSHLLGG